MITKKARIALQHLAIGSREGVTSQMIDRLSRERLIDFDLSISPSIGWFVTDKGWNALRPCGTR